MRFLWKASLYSALRSYAGDAAASKHSCIQHSSSSHRCLDLELDGALGTAWAVAGMQALVQIPRTTGSKCLIRFPHHSGSRELMVSGHPRCHHQANCLFPRRGLIKERLAPGGQRAAWQMCTWAHYVPDQQCGAPACWGEPPAHLG